MHSSATGRIFTHTWYQGHLVMLCTGLFGYANVCMYVGGGEPETNPLICPINMTGVRCAGFPWVMEFLEKHGILKKFIPDMASLGI